MKTACTNMTSIVEQLTDDQKNTLEELKRNLGEVLDDNHTDEILVKFLRSKTFNLEATKKIFLEKYFGRIVFGINTVLDTFEIPEVMKKYATMANLGFAKDGTTIRYFAMGRMDFYGAMKTSPTFDLMLLLASETEIDLNALKEKSLITGKQTSEITYVLDYSHFRLQQILHKTVIEMGIELMQSFQDYFPELWRRVLVVNAPIYIDVVKKIYNAVMRSSLAEKIIYASPDNSKELLLKYIDADVLPAFLGGERVDPMCKELISSGGEIPEELYSHNCQTLLSADDPDVRVVHIGRGRVFNLTVKIEEPDSRMRLQARTEGGSLTLNVFYKEFDSLINNDTVIPEEFDCLDDKWENFKYVSFEVKSLLHICQEDLKLYFPWPGMYVVNFSNASSWFASKTLFFKYSLISSTSQSS